ncbi:hypothetical protein K1T71_000678 [Dendrolimus kikuchii]|uniref:Uncharacterized protein n=1 Tax=Dendrolimus kikuchii TaxID=765133 RepID=A0ACC1DKD6_9NEOP|nr:hypothetical protein K1T71_000678 [Dendrolimus kikuchii]
MFLPVTFIAILIALQTNAYVLLQVKKDNNQSNIDALIHKVVPSGTNDKVTKKNTDLKVNARKSKYYDSGSDDHALEHLVLNIDTGSKKNDKSTTKWSDVLKTIEKTILNYARNNPSPIYRGNDGNVIKPEVVHFRSGHGKPSIVVDVNSKSIIQALKDMLSSKAIISSLKVLTRQAAVVFRAFNEEMANQKRGY